LELLDVAFFAAPAPIAFPRPAISSLYQPTTTAKRGGGWGRNRRFVCDSASRATGDEVSGAGGGIYRGAGPVRQPMGSDHADHGAGAVGCVRADGGCARWAGRAESAFRKRREAVEGRGPRGLSTFRFGGFASENAPPSGSPGLVTCPSAWDRVSVSTGFGSRDLPSRWSETGFCPRPSLSILFTLSPMGF
jgi:hypothetical protein